MLLKCMLIGVILCSCSAPRMEKRDLYRVEASLQAVLLDLSPALWSGFSATSDFSEETDCIFASFK